MTKPAVAVLVFVLLVQPSMAGAARVLSQYDLDSLADQSKVIVRAEVGDAQPFVTVDGNCVVHTVTVLDAVEGPVAKGTQIRVAGLDAFCRAPGVAGRGDSWGTLGKGDVVYLFLVPNDGHGGYAMYRLTNAEWTVIESGARLVSGGNVYAFGQLFDRLDAPEALRAAPDGFVAITPATFPKVSVETEREFGLHLQRSARDAAQVDALLAAETTPKSTAQMATLLRSRAAMVANEGARDDELGRTMAARLADTLAPADLVALRGDVGADVRFVLESGLEQRRAGRSYLLDRIGDVREGAERRLDLAGNLSAAGWSYELSVEAAGADQAAALHVDFATSLARLAVANLGTELCGPVLNGVTACSLRPCLSDGALSADLDSAADILCEGFPRAGPLDQFRIAETLMLVRPVRYKRLLPHAGPFLTLVEPSSDFADALGHRQLHLQCRFRNLLTMPTELKLVLRPVNGGPEVSLAIDGRIGDVTDSFGDRYAVDVAIPDAAAAEYDVFLRDFRDGQPTGDGLPLRIKVPAK